MVYYIIKVLLSSVIIVTISEVSKKSSLIGGILASLPLVSILGIIWLYIDTQNTQQIIELSKSIFWLVIPSLTLFIALPILLNKGVNFYLALIISIFLMVLFYYLTIFILDKIGIHV